MIRVFVKKQSKYPVSGPNIKKKLKEYLEKQGIVSDSEVSVGIVGIKKMKSLSGKYLNDDLVHNVLSFTYQETGEKFAEPPDEVIQLGEIYLCFPKIFEEAKDEGVLIEKKVEELLKHGADHLLGKHHE